MNCYTFAMCDDHASPSLCHRLLFNLCMSQRQYFQITNSMIHIKETFVTLRDKFLGIIDYLDETFRSITPLTSSRQKRQVNICKTQIREHERQLIVRTMDILGELGSKISSTYGIPNSFQEYPYNI